MHGDCAQRLRLLLLLACAAGLIVLSTSLLSLAWMQDAPSMLQLLGGGGGDTSAFWSHASELPRRTCHLIASVSSGRSGSHYLSQLLALANETRSDHEARPVMDTRVACRFPRELSYRQRRSLKLPSLLVALRENAHYADTSHLFGKTWWDIAVREVVQQRGCRLDVVVLRRFLPYVVDSLLHVDIDFWHNVHVGW